MSKKHHHRSRREFLGQLTTGCASLGITTMLSSMTNMSLLNASANCNLNFSSNSDYKALVCILLNGGNDSYNMLIPRGSEGEYEDYSTVRSNLAIPQDQILPINPINHIDRSLGLHPNLIGIQSLFDSQKLSFIANAGALVQPTSLSEFRNNTNLPLGLFSHSDQRQHWQTSVPQDRDALGWAGRMTDLLNANNPSPNVGLNVSLSGLNVFQRGNLIDTTTLSPNGNGAILINNSTNNGFSETLKRQTIDNLLDQNYVNILEQAYAGTVTGSKANSLVIDNAISSIPDFTTTFPDTNFGRRMRMIAKVIAAQDILGLQRQTFFISMGGYDTHDDILDIHGALMSELDTVLSAFYNVLDQELMISDKVTTFTASEFSRRLVSNGDGSDHAWGGHSIVMGGGIQGGHIFGQYPDLYEGNSLDIGQGRIIPTTSCDEIFAEMALWFGASSSDLDLILPNLQNFWDYRSSTPPLGLYI